MEHNCEYELLIGLLFLRLHVALEYLKKKGKKRKNKLGHNRGKPVILPLLLEGSLLAEA